MIEQLKRMIRDWPGEVVVIRRDEATAAWVFVALHSSRRGTPVGGTRMKVYEQPTDGLRDALRLAEGMSYKWASLDLPRGGGKAVLALSRPLDPPERRGLLERYGRLLESMDGAFGTGEDLGTTPEDMAWLARHTRHVHGVQPDGSVMDPGPFTAHGVYHGILAGVRWRFDQSTLQGLSALVQGLGDVGEPLARRLHDAGAKLLLSDLDSARAERLAAEFDAELVTPEQVYETPCDLFVPCAVGGILNRETIPRLACQIVAGSANNQLGEAEDGPRLHERGITYLPDYVLNSGGALALGTLVEGDTPEDLLRRVERVGVLISEVLERSDQSGTAPATVARALAEERLQAAPGNAARSDATEEE